MAAQSTTTVSVESPTDVERLEADLRSHDIDRMIVETPEGSTALLTIGEVRRLMHTAREFGTRLVFVTDDPLRRELIVILGGELRSTNLPAAPAPARTSSRRNDDVTRRIGYASTDAIPAPRTSPPVDVHAFDASEPSFSFLLAPPVDQRSSSNTSRRPDQRHAPAPTRHGSKAGKLIGSGMVLSLIVVGAIAALYAAPSATILVTPDVRQITAEVTYGVAAPGSSWDITVQPETRSIELTYSGSIPASGSRDEPSVAASGELQLTNASTDEVLVPAGTEVVSESGEHFAIVDDVVVPAADPFGTLTFGSATAEIKAAALGLAGNVDPETIVGQLDSGVFFTNREATSGGANRQVQVVTQTDVDALKATAASNLNNRVTLGLASQIAVGEQMLAGSEQRQSIQFAFDHQPGDAASSLHLDATLRASVLAHNLGEVQAAAQDAAANKLASGSGGDALDADTVSMSEPEPIDGSAVPAYRIVASAKTVADLDEASLDQLRSAAAGVSESRAEAMAAAIAGVANVDVRTSPSWLHLGMPRRASRIEVVVVGIDGSASQVEATPAASGP